MTDMSMIVVATIGAVIVGSIVAALFRAQGESVNFVTWASCVIMAGIFVATVVVIIGTPNPEEACSKAGGYYTSSGCWSQAPVEKKLGEECKGHAEAVLLGRRHVSDTVFKCYEGKMIPLP